MSSIDVTRVCVGLDEMLSEKKTVGVELERSELTRPVSVAAPHHYCRFLLSCCCLSCIVGNKGTTFLQQRKATIARMVIVRPSQVL